MSDENKNESNGIATQSLEDQTFNEAMAMLHGETEKEQKEAVADDQPKEEVKEETKEEVAEVKEEPQAEVKAETPAPDTAKPETKPLYTPEEIKNELRVHGDLARLDSSRLSEEGKLIQASVMSGLTPKLQRAAEIEKNYQALLKQGREDAERKAKEDAAKLFEKEKEDFGEELANYRKEIRETKEMVAQIQRERDGERQVFQAEQQKIAAQQFNITFMEKAKEYGVPATPEWRELTLAKVLAENQIRSLNGEPYISVEDGLRYISETVGLSSVDNLDKLLDANPKLREALENKFAEKQSKKKEAGPTMIKSSSGGGGKSEVKPSAADKDVQLLNNEDMVAYALRLAKQQNG